MIEAFTDNFLKPGNLAGGFAHYRAAHGARIRMMKGEAPLLPADHGADLLAVARARSAVSVRTGPTGLARVLAISTSRSFRASDTFSHREDPDRAAAEIAAFFQRVGWR